MASGSTARPIVRIAAILALILLLSVAALWLVVRDKGGTLGLDGAPGDALLSELADAAQLTPSATGAPTHVDANGTTADTSTRAYRVPAIAPARAAVLRACAGQGLAEPGADDRTLMPHIVCQGGWRDRDATVHLEGRCDGDCIVTLEVRMI